jgi:FAD/FMN-containing dehydrogenase/Fe-S oxidoreductase
MKQSTLVSDLQKKLKCEVRADVGTKAVYSTDASNYRHVPLVVVFPRTAEEIIETVAICREHGAPIVMRGGGTSLAGQGANEAVMIETSKYYNRILEIDVEGRTATVQPGIVLDSLRDEAKKSGLTFGPDPATHSRCTLGGMLGNNSCGVHSVMAGRTADNVVELDVLTYDGVRMRVGRTSAEDFAHIQQEGGRKAEIYASLFRLRERYIDKIRARYPKIPRRVSGYNLDELLPERDFNLARALVGTESTCVIILAAKLKLVPEPKQRGILMIGYDDIFNAAAACPKLIQLGPIGLEAIDDRLVEHMRTKHIRKKEREELPDGNSWLLLEVGGEDLEDVKRQLEKISVHSRRATGFKDQKIVTDKNRQKELWDVREAGLGATALVPGEEDTWEGWEDSAVDPENLPQYLRALRKLYNKYGYDGALYGHFGQGCVHTRTNWDLLTADGIAKYRRFIHEAADLVIENHGSISGEHGDGQSKAELLPKMFGPELVRGFEEFKAIWDPQWKMNPGRIVKARSPVQDLRFGVEYKPIEVKTHFQFPDDGGSFARATTRCVGVGACRRKEGGVMCPSYKVTHEEKHTTRGRARLLFEMMNGKLIRDGWQSKAVKESLDLCLACKGCKNDCPVGVDMATYKAEFLSHFFERHFRPREAFAMGQIHIAAKFASVMPRFVNWILSIKLCGALAKWLGGIHQKREMPKFAKLTFRKKHGQEAGPKLVDVNQPRALLWVDTFSNHFHPEVAAAAKRVLEDAGFSVLLPEKHYCCGRPLYDYGFLKQAKGYLRRVLDDLAPLIQEGVPFVHLEPSCASVFTDEMVNLFPKDMNALRLKKQTFMLSQFLVERAPNYQWPKVAGMALVQGHCHHQSVLKFDTEKEAFKRMDLQCEVLDSGCCGMAGSFGFSKEHYEISQTIGESVLFKKIRESSPETIILANGFSCRTHIEQGTGRKALHLAEVLDQAKRRGVQPVIQSDLAQA